MRRRALLALLALAIPLHAHGAEEIANAVARHPAGGPAVVSGILLVDERPAVEAMLVGLGGRSRPGFDPPAPELRVMSDAGGRFRFEGLPRDWSGTLYAPDSFLVSRRTPNEASSHWVELAEPAADLELALMPLPTVVGRVLDAAGSRPIPGAKIAIRVSRKTPGISVYRGMKWEHSASEDGRFRIRLDEDPDVLDVGVALDSAGSGASYQRYPREDLQVSADGIIDLGDLEVYPTREIEVQIVDDEGQPVVEGAVVTLEPAAEDRTTADASGLALLHARGRVEWVVVGKPGFWPVRLPVPDGPQASLVARLSRENRLEVVVTDQQGNPQSELTVQLSRDEGPLHAIRSAGSEPWIPVPTRILSLFIEYFEERGALSVGGGPDGGLSADTGQYGELVIRRIWPSSPLRIRVRTSNRGPILHERTLPPMGESERRGINVTIEPLPPVSGVVLAPDSTPVSGARVELYSRPVGDVGSLEQSASTNEAGTFSVRWPDAAQAPAIARVEADGYAVLVQRLVTTAAAPLVFVLEPPRTVQVTVVDELGQVIPEVDVGSRAGSGEIIAFSSLNDP